MEIGGSVENVFCLMAPSRKDFYNTEQERDCLIIFRLAGLTYLTWKERTKEGWKLRLRSVLRAT